MEVEPLLRRHRRLAPALLGVVFASLASMGWLRWPDHLVDFGRELYIPWRLGEGDVLGRDVYTLFGPLSHSFHAVVFRVFGPSVRIILVTNLALAALMMFGIHRFFRASADRTAALLAGLVFALVFAFAQYEFIAGSNYIAPYAHEVTHGLILSLGLVACLAAQLRRPRSWRAALAGGLIGLIFLTKVEVAAAAVAVCGAAAALGVMRPEPPGARAARLACFFGAAAVAPLAFFIGFSRHLAPDDAWRVVAGAFAGLGNSDITSNRFYLVVSGFDRPAANAWLALKALAGLILACAAMAGSARILARIGSGPARAAFWLVALAGAAWIALTDIDSLRPLARPLQLTSLAACLYYARLFWIRRARPRASARLAAMFLWSAFSLSLLLKIVLNCKVGHYGAFLAMPATLLLVTWLIRDFPALATRTRPQRAALRSLVLLAIVAISVAHAQRTAEFMRAKNLPMSDGADRIFTYDPQVYGEGVTMAATLDWLQENTPPDASLLVVPEGVILNYLARRANPTPYINFMPIELALYGEDVIVAALEANPPDIIVLAHKNTQEYGVGFFGNTKDGYGRGIVEWMLGAGYQSVASFGHEPFRDVRFGTRILKRIEPEGARQMP